jgi:hypothetical protein
MNQEITLDELKAEHASETGRIMNAYLDETERIRQETAPEDGRYLDKLSSEERMNLLYEQKVGRAGEAYESTRDAYAAQTQAFHEAHQARVRTLQERLFKVTDTATASRAATASETELSDMLSYARLSGNTDLGRAAFTAAHARSAGHLLGQYFETDPEAQGLYQEYSGRVAPEVLARQTDTGRVVQPPDLDRLMPPARAWT